MASAGPKNGRRLCHVSGGDAVRKGYRVIGERKGRQDMFVVVMVSVIIMIVVTMIVVTMVIAVARREDAE